MSDIFTFILLSLATYRLTRLFIEDVIFEPLREKIWEKYPPERKMLGYLLTCYWCLGLWMSIFVVTLYLLAPVPTLVGAAVLALSAVVGILDQKM